MKKPLRSLLVSAVFGLASLHAATVNVTITGVSFNPKVVTINVGDTVTWTGGQNVHTVSPRPGVTEEFCGGMTMTQCSQTFLAPGSYAYVCNIHASSFSMTGVVHVVGSPTSMPPLVSITNPVHNALFAAPAQVPVGITATDLDGAVANVELFTNGVSAGVLANSPFLWTVTNFAQGHYSLTARATDNQGLSATSAPIVLRVVNPPVLTAWRPNQLLFTPGEAPPIQFNFNTVTGVSYIIEAATELNGFSPVSTNAGNGLTQQFTESNSPPAQRFYRLSLE